MFTKPMFEPLETRQMMAANIAVINGVLRIDGTDSADKISVEATLDLATVNGGLLGGTQTFIPRYHVKVTDADGVVRNAPDGTPLERAFLRSGISRIDVYAGGGSDTVATGSTAVNNTVYCGSGFLDDVTTGAGNDVVYGEGGLD